MDGGTMELQHPELIISDFDRTLAYLYRNERLLSELAEEICDYYSAYLSIDPALYTIDGYKAWHSLHRMAESRYDHEKAMEINEQAERLVTAFEFRVMEHTPFFDNVIETIKHLHRAGIQLMIVSSNSDRVIRYALERENILHCFSHIIGRVIPFDPDRIKPSPYPIEQGLRYTNAEKKNIWYVGDDIVDVEAATACGIIPIGVASGKYSAHQLKARGAVFAVEGFADIITLIRE